MTDTVGRVALGWKVSDLNQHGSHPRLSGGRPGLGGHCHGQIRGSVTPAVSQFNARTADGINYRVL